MTIHNFWPQEHVSYLGVILVDGLSFKEAAQALNERFGTDYSRNAVIGKSKREGFKQPDKPWHRLTTVSKPEREGKPTLEATALRVTHTRRGPVRSIPALPREIIQLRCAEIEPLHLDLLDLDRHHCRWPYGDQNITFCGHSKMVGSYCLAHFQLSVGPGTASERAAA